MWEYAIGAAAAAVALYASKMAPKVWAAYQEWVDGRAFLDLKNLFTRIKTTWKSRPKLSGWLLTGLLAVASVIYLAPTLGSAILYKFAMSNLCIIWLYWLCVHIWPHSNPDNYLDADSNINKGEEIQYAACFIGQVLFVILGFLGFALLV